MRRSAATDYKSFIAVASTAAPTQPETVDAPPGSNKARARRPSHCNRPKVSLLARALLVCDRLLPARPFGCRSMAACPSSETGPGDMCRIPVPPQAVHVGDLYSSYPSTVLLPDDDDYCSASSRMGADGGVDSRQLSRSVPLTNGLDSGCTRPSLVRSEDRHKWVNPPPNKNPFSNNCPQPTSRSRQRLPTHTGVSSGMRRPAAPVAVRHDSWSHSPPSGDQQQSVARTLPDWRPENLAPMVARSPPTRNGHASAPRRAAPTPLAHANEACFIADCSYCSSSATTTAAAAVVIVAAAATTTTSAADRQ
uniref:Uncharacterized protein n=1 Tax=Plectus sambesii TaxID=2011161 RepID=A0A914WK84_9BILA